MSDQQASSMGASGIYSAPRRFDLTTVFVATTAFAVLYAALLALNAPLIVVGIICAMLTLVALGQAVLFRSRYPRLASSLVGSIFSAITAGTLAAVSGNAPAVVPLAIVNAFAGIFYGYFAGVLVGSVFMTAEAIRKLAGRKRGP